MPFSKLQLVSSIQKAVQLCGYPAPTPIQEQAIPRAIEGRDLIATAQTGTGKTAAFVLPALQRLTAPSTLKGKGPRVLVLTPTRELANQVSDAVRTYGKFMRIRSGAILGGMPYYEQQRLLSQPVDIVIATPGRLIDHMESGRVNFSRLELLVLDEADRMLDMGFSEAVKTISAATPATRQTLLFTATWDRTMETLARNLLKEPVRVEVAGKKTTLDTIEQRLHAADDMQHKSRLLHHLISDESMTRAIIFSSTKRHADQLARELTEQGNSAEALHGDMTQGARNRVIMKMKRGSVRLLVATDVAARGLDVTGITHVINYDLPKNAEDYVHRIGRTGRAGATGIAISFASSRELDVLARIERYIGQTLTRHVIPGIEPRYTLGRRSGSGGSRSSASRGGYSSSRPNGAGGGFRKPGAWDNRRAASSYDGRPKYGSDGSRQDRETSRPAYQDKKPGTWDSRRTASSYDGRPKYGSDGSRQDRETSRPAYQDYKKPGAWDNRRTAASYDGRPKYGNDGYRQDRETSRPAYRGYKKSAGRPTEARSAASGRKGAGRN